VLVKRALDGIVEIIPLELSPSGKYIRITYPRTDYSEWVNREDFEWHHRFLEAYDPEDSIGVAVGPVLTINRTERGLRMNVARLYTLETDELRKIKEWLEELLGEIDEELEEREELQEG